MSEKNLRSKVIRLAKANPDLRAHLLPLVQKQALSGERETLGERLVKMKRGYLHEVVMAVFDLAKEEDFDGVKVKFLSKGSMAQVTGTDSLEGDLWVRLYWGRDMVMHSDSELGDKYRQAGKRDALTTSPESMAHIFFYSHLQGVVGQ